ncbi:BCLAF1 and THRAP3 family member 3 isoform X1 [Xenopus laevis]|uniref:BCLAF1 and THRAP3 family member 3 isoform X1 n=1 Tax=Xenopus laevis TaxID=8355 RepID=A0A8J0UJS0_XENLA|nr:BCLAF1 and THRAP3 family member 3 isoform X1 [Xenopus laevis]XP_018104559.1 BCLAF1 and THRAP3 family member 3 isoform X1 [Xenopus laevis]XP_018104560.1 BCLAF1 and THRAP3 family member 3 isoform X1 [Xenopus laevis]
MAKSRSRSPSWKHRQPAYRSPEHQRQKHFQDHCSQENGFRRNSRRPLHWEEGRHRQNNTRTQNFNRFNDKPYELDSFPTNSRKSPVDKFDREKRIYSPERHRDHNKSPIEKFDREKKIYSPERHRHNNKSPIDKFEREKRIYSPERHRDGNRFGPPRFSEEAPYRDNDNGYYHINQGHNTHEDSSDFRVGRREDDIHGHYPSENNWEWSNNQDHWNNQNQNDEILPPPRRHSQDFGERSSFHKRFPEDQAFREQEPPFKRLRENERSDLREQHRNSHWKTDHSFQPYGKDWPKDMDLGDPRPFVHRTNTGEFKKIEYDYSHRSPNYVGKEQNSRDDRDHKYSRHEERTHNRTRNSHHGKPLDSHFKDNGSKITERIPELSTKYSSKHSQNFNSDSYKQDIKGRPPSPRQNDRKEDELRKQSPSPHNWKDKTPKTTDPKASQKTMPAAETIMVSLALKNPADKYRDGVSPSDRQMSQDLVATGRKESFHSVFKHIESSNEIPPSRPKTEFTQEIRTIIHEVKANHFKSTDLTLHERFSNLKSNDSIQESSLNITVPQTNPEIHRRIDISLEDLQSKSLNKRIEAPPVSHRVIEDPNDLRHDIERRRKERLQSEENGGTDVSVGERAQKHQAGDFQNSSKLSRPPFRKPTGRHPGSYYRGNPNQYYNSQNFEDTNGIRRPYKGQ